MFDHKHMTYNGTAVAYATLPMYMLNIIMLDDRLTPSAFKVFIRLMAYASAVNSCHFKITNTWLEKNTGLSDKTVARAMAQLKACGGYVDDIGVVYMEPPEEAKRAAVKQSLPTEQRKSPRPQPSVQLDIFTDAMKIVETEVQTTDRSSELNAILRSLGSVKNVQRGRNSVQVTPQTSDFTPQNSDPIITIPNNTLLKNTPTESSDKVATQKPTDPTEQSGLLFSASQKGFVENTKPKPLASFLPTLGKGQTVAIGKPQASLSNQHEGYIRSALTRMNVTSQQERQRYTNEIAYAATQGAFSETYRHTPLKAIRACLNLVEAGKWRANGGMY